MLEEKGKVCAKPHTSAGAMRNREGQSFLTVILNMNIPVSGSYEHFFPFVMCYFIQFLQVYENPDLSPFP